MMSEYIKHVEFLEAVRRYPDVSPMIILKLSMILHGVKLTDRALDRLQAPDYCFGELEPFGLGAAGKEKVRTMPGPILLRDATFVYINYGEAYENPYYVDWDPSTGIFSLYEADLFIDEVDFVPRPAFFGKKTTKGTPMESIAVVRAQKLILTAFQKCLFWKEGDQCHYCAFFTNGSKTEEVDCEDIYETVHEAIKEPGRFTEIYLSGGSDYRGDPPFSQEIDRYIRVFQAIGRDFKGRFPSQLMAPAYQKADLQRIYDQTGLTSYSPNIEIWDKELFRRLCPGKEKWIGYEEWIRRTIDSVEVFGRGNVYTQLVAGAELAKPAGFATEAQALKSNFECCEFFAKNDVICLSTIWRPHKKTRLGYQKCPSLDYYIQLAKGFHDIRQSYGLRTIDDDYKRCGNHPDSDLERTDA